MVDMAAFVERMRHFTRCPMRKVAGAPFTQLICAAFLRAAGFNENRRRQSGGSPGPVLPYARCLYFTGVISCHTFATILNFPSHCAKFK
jgi:hypothetical protein